MRTIFLHELTKDNGLLIVEWILTDDNSSDIFTKKLQGPLFNKHAGVYRKQAYAVAIAQEEGLLH